MAEIRTWRIEKAERFRRDAERAYANEMWETCINRCYYGAYHLVAAVLAEKAGVERPRWGHVQLHKEFLDHFCKLGRYFSMRDGDLLQRLREAREAADYEKGTLNRRRTEERLKSRRELCTKALKVLQDG